MGRRVYKHLGNPPVEVKDARIPSDSSPETFWEKPKTVILRTSVELIWWKQYENSRTAGEEEINPSALLSSTILFWK